MYQQCTGELKEMVSTWRTFEHGWMDTTGSVVDGESGRRGSKNEGKEKEGGGERERRRCDKKLN